MYSSHPPARPYDAGYEAHHHHRRVPQHEHNPSGPPDVLPRWAPSPYDTEPSMDQALRGPSPRVPPPQEPSTSRASSSSSQRGPPPPPPLEQEQEATYSGNAHQHRDSEAHFVLASYSQPVHPSTEARSHGSRQNDFAGQLDEFDPPRRELPAFFPQVYPPPQRGRDEEYASDVEASTFFAVPPSVPSQRPSPRSLEGQAPRPSHHQFEHEDQYHQQRPPNSQHQHLHQEQHQQQFQNQPRYQRHQPPASIQRLPVQGRQQAPVPALSSRPPGMAHTPPSILRSAPQAGTWTHTPLAPPPPPPPSASRVSPSTRHPAPPPPFAADSPLRQHPRDSYASSSSRHAAPPPAHAVLSPQYVNHSLAARFEDAQPSFRSAPRPPPRAAHASPSARHAAPPSFQETAASHQARAPPSARYQAHDHQTTQHAGPSSSFQAGPAPQQHQVSPSMHHPAPPPHFYNGRSPLPHAVAPSAQAAPSPPSRHQRPPSPPQSLPPARRYHPKTRAYPPFVDNQWPNVGPERAIPGSSPGNQFHPPAPDPRIAAAPPFISETSMRQRADLERRAMQTAAAASTADRLLRNAQADFNQSCKSVEERSQSLTRAQEHMNLAQINWILRSAERKQLLLMREAVEKEMEELRGKMTRGTGASEKEAARSKSGTTQGEKAVGSPQRATRGRQRPQKQKGKEKEKQQPEEQAAPEAGSSSTSNTALSSKKAETVPSDTAQTRRSGLRRRRSSAAELDNGADGDRNGAGTSTTAAEAANTEPDPDSTISERPAKRTRRSATVAAAAAAATPTKSSSSASAIPASAEPSQEGEDESEQAATQVPAPPPPTQSQAATTPSTSRRMTRSAARHA